MKLLGILFPFLVLSIISCFLLSPTFGYVTSFPDEPDIDGILTTVGICVAEWLAGLLPYPGVSFLLEAIINAWTPKPEDDYWEQVEQQVIETCGTYINNDNIDKVLVYKDDLIDLMKIYEHSPVQGDGTYPDKKTQADAISTSIISNRYLVEASSQPWSMTLYFVDIASVHITILKDAAECYSFPDAAPSLWWKDLRNELEHYTDYSRTLYNETKEFRKSNVECYFDEGKNTDTYTITDHVTGYEETCTQTHPEDGAEGSCDNACLNFENQMLRDMTNWYMKYVGRPANEWENLRLLAVQMAELATP